MQPPAPCRAAAARGRGGDGSRYRLQGEVKTGLMFGRSVHLRRNGEIIPGDFIPE